MSTDKGYVKIYRDIRDHWIWKYKPFDPARAWIDLILLANHADKTILFDDATITVKKGQHMTSNTILAERWGWNRTKVHRFIKRLVKQGMISKSVYGRGTLLTIEKYGDYQDTRNAIRNDDETEALRSRYGGVHKQDIIEGTKEDTKKNKRKNRDEIDLTPHVQILEPGDEYDTEGWEDP